LEALRCQRERDTVFTTFQAETEFDSPLLRVNYGSILNVRVFDGDVCFDTPPEILVDVKLDIDLTRRPELELTDFALPAETRLS
jgi:hypothetical protein